MPINLPLGSIMKKKKNHIIFKFSSYIYIYIYSSPKKAIKQKQKENLIVKWRQKRIPTGLSALR